MDTLPEVLVLSPEILLWFFAFVELVEILLPFQKHSSFIVRSRKVLLTFETNMRSVE